MTTSLSRRAPSGRDPRGELPGWPPAATAMLALGMASATCACSRETSGGAAASSPSEASKGRSSAPGDTSPPASPAGGGPARRCAPWSDAASLVATSQGGRRDFFREFEYDFASGVLHVHDSDPFPTGKEASQPRVTEDAITLSGASKDKVERALFVVCPGPEALARRCAPGGCQRLTVTDRSGNSTRVEDEPTVSAVMREFEPLFPKLRVH